MASARRGLTAKLKRRLTPEHLDALLKDAVAKQRCVCLCCGLPREVTLDWSLDETNDDGLPLLRGAICRSCKIAVGRLMIESRYVLMPKVLERTERYVSRPWWDPDTILQRLGLKRNFLAEQAEREAETRYKSTDDTIAWLKSIGIDPAARRPCDL